MASSMSAEEIPSVKPGILLVSLKPSVFLPYQHKPVAGHLEQQLKNFLMILWKRTTNPKEIGKENLHIRAVFLLSALEYMSTENLFVCDTTM